MSQSTAIGMVSQSLQNMLLGEMTLIPTVNVTVLAPDESGGDRRINLFLYKVQENPTFKNADWQVKSGDANTLVPPPLSLNLFYLMTPYTQNDPQSGNSAAHEVLGEAMRVFFENPSVPQDYLVDGLKDAGEQIKIMLNSLDLEEMSQIWNTFSQPFRLSVPYEVSVVQLDKLPAGERPLPTRVSGIGVPQVEAPFKPPVVESFAPISGTAGSVITFQGQNLAGWYAYVTMAGKLELDGVELTQDSFDLNVPMDTSPGFHEIRVDISHLFRKTFFFEVKTT